MDFVSLHTDDVLGVFGAGDLRVFDSVPMTGRLLVQIPWLGSDVTVGPLNKALNSNYSRVSH